MTAPRIAPHSDRPRSGWMAVGGRFLWITPLLLSVAFTALVVTWAQDNDRVERETIKRTVMADTLSLEAQLAGRIETETIQLRAAALRLPSAGPDGSRQLAALPEIAAGLDRRWLSVVWVDANHRIVGEARRAQRPGVQRLPLGEGITLHLVASTSDARRPLTGQLIARYDPADLIQSKDFWWLAAQYEVKLVSGLDQVIVSTESQGRTAYGESYEMAFTAIPDARLRLTQRTRHLPWFSTLPVVLMVGFLALISVATWLLRRQINQVAKAESAWRNEAAWRQALQESALVGLRARDLDGRLLFANRTFCELVGYSLEELVTQGPALDALIQPRAGNAAQRARREGYETRWRHRNGHFIDVMVFESPLVDGLGQQVGWMGSIVDVTERKRLEELERRQREVLANHARLSTLGEVASTLAHELNQPLTSIVSYSAGIAKALERKPGTDPDLVAAAQALSRHATQAGGIVHRIRSRLARREPVLEACAINQIVSDAVALLQREIRRAGVEVSLDLGTGLPDARVDRIGIEQVVSNLLRNACDAMTGSAHGKKLHLRTRLCAPPPVPSALDWIAVEVSDQGPGLGGKDIETLTEPFFSTKQEGTGLGLAICRSILESHGGVLHASDCPGGGACFSFFLPTEGSNPETSPP